MPRHISLYGYKKQILGTPAVNKEAKFANKSIKFEKINILEKNNYKSIKGTFKVQDLVNNNLFFEPEIRIYNQPNISTSEADIKTNFFTDNILIFNLLKEKEYFSVRYQYKPLMIWVWLSTIFLAFGGILGFFRR